MKPGFLNDPKASKNGLGPLRDPRSSSSWHIPAALSSNGSLGSASKDWKIGWRNASDRRVVTTTHTELGWGKERRVVSTTESDVVMKDNDDHDNDDDGNNKDAMSEATRATKKTFASCSTISTVHSTPDSFTPSLPTTPPPSSFVINNSNSDSNNNPFAGQPWLPNKTMGVPKAALNAWYMQKPRHYQCTKDQYITWNDGGMPHRLKFTSVLVCPMSGELFFSGEYGDSKQYVVQEDHGAKVVWYAKKTLAEHGAAARAYDCHSYRQYFGTTMRSVHLGLDTPYLSPALALDLHQPAPPLPPPLPPHVESLVQEQVKMITQRMDIDAIVADAHRQAEEENLLSDREVHLERDQYREARGGGGRPTV